MTDKNDPAEEEEEWYPEELDYGVVITEEEGTEAKKPVDLKFVLTICGVVLSGIILTTGISFIFNLLNLFHTIKTPYYIVSDNSSNFQWTGYKTQMFYFVATFTLKIFSWEACFPTYLSSFVLKWNFRYLYVIVLVLAGSFSSYISTYNSLMNTSIAPVLGVTGVIYVFALLCPIIIPQRVPSVDLYIINKWTNLIFWLTFTFTITPKWLAQHEYYIHKVGADMIQYRGIYLIGFYIYLMVILVQTIECVTVYFVKREAPSIDLQFLDCVLMYTSAIYLWVCVVTFYGVCVNCGSSTDNLHNFTLKGQDCWWEETHFISSADINKYFEFNSPRKMPGVEVTAAIGTDKPKTNEYYPFLVTLAWGPCEPLRTKAIYSKTRCMGTLLKSSDARDMIVTSAECFESQWNRIIVRDPRPALIFYNYYKKTFSLPVTDSTYSKQRNVIHSQDRPYILSRDNIAILMPIENIWGTKMYRLNYQKRHLWADLYEDNKLESVKNLTVFHMLKMHDNKVGVTEMEEEKNMTKCIQELQDKGHWLSTDGMLCMKPKSGKCSGLPGAPLIKFDTSSEANEKPYLVGLLATHYLYGGKTPMDMFCLFFKNFTLVPERETQAKEVVKEIRNSANKVDF